MYMSLYGSALDCMYAHQCLLCEANILGKQSCVLDPLRPNLFGPGSFGPRGAHDGP